MNMTQTLETVNLLTQAIQNENADLAESIVKSLRPIVGVDYLVDALKQYMALAPDTTGLSEESANIALDLLNPLLEAQTTLKDDLYVAPNLSPEVKALLDFLEGEAIEKTLSANSPNWFMMPSLTWQEIRRLTVAARGRHS